MSTKTSIKRVALIAVSALGFGLMSVVPSSALDGTGTATLAGPVRVSFTDGVRDTVSAQTFTFTNIAAEIADGGGTTLTMEVTQAPTTAAVVQINLGGSENTSDSLGANATAATTGANVLAAAVTSAGTGSGTIAISSNAASGTYKGTFTLGDGTDTIVVSWSFTTTGKVASINTDADKYEMPAVAEDDGANDAVDETDDSFVVSKVITVTLKDSAGATTQPATGDTISFAITSATNITFAATASATATGSLSNANLVDGAHTVTVGSQTATADSETVTFTPLGVMPAQGVAAKSVTVATAGFASETAVDTVLTSPSSTSVVVAGTAAGSEASYKVDPSNAIYVFKSTGYGAGAAYRIGVEWTNVSGGGGSATVNDDVSNTTASALTSGTVKYLYGIAGATGTVNVTVTVTSAANTDTIEINAENANTNYTAAADALVTNTSAAYAVSTSTPVSTSLQVAGTAINVTGAVTDTYGNPVPGATVGLAGVVTSTVATDANLTATTTTAADGTWSASLTPTAATTQVVVTASATKTGIASISSAAAITINFNASGSPSTLTYSDAVGDQDTATALSPATIYPAARVAYAGVLAGITDETYTISSGAVSADTDPADVCVGFTATTDPGAQVVFTGSAGVKFSKTCAGTETLASATDSVTVASGTIAYAVATKVGLNTVTMTSGTVSKTANFWAANEGDGDVMGDAIRNLSVDKASLEINGGEYAFITISATDAFGNLVKSAVTAGGASVLVKATGSALLDGPALSRTYTTTDADGNIVVGVVAGLTAGTATITIEGSGAQLGAAAGAATGTTAGTNGLTASTNTLTVKVTVTGNAQDATEAAVEATDAANQAYEAAVVATETAEAAVAAAEDAKAAADAATAAVEALATQVSTMMAALKAQVTKLAKTVATILKKVS